MRSSSSRNEKNKAIVHLTTTELGVLLGALESYLANALHEVPAEREAAKELYILFNSRLHHEKQNSSEER